MRDILNVVIAEDDKDRQKELYDYLSNVGGYTVAATDSVWKVVELVELTNAAWLILDLELSDGNATEIVRPLRDRFGDDVFILVLTGFWERYSEQRLISDGVDIVLRKPYSPAALVQQLKKLRQTWRGERSSARRMERISICGGELNLSEGTFRIGSRIVRFTNAQRMLVDALGQALADGNDPWVSRGDVLLRVYGETVSLDDKTYGDRMRQHVKNIRRLTGCHEFISSRRETNNSSWYCLGGVGELEVEEQQDA